MFLSEMNRGYYIGYVRTFGNQSRLAINHGVINFALFLVFRVGRLDQTPSELTFKFNNIFMLHISSLFTRP